MITLKEYEQKCNHEFINLIDGCTIRGSHLHVYKCVLCDYLEYGIEILTEGY